MFIVTMVFLTGVIFTVQQLLFQYAELDLSIPLQKTDFFMLHNTRNLLQQSLIASNCAEAEENLQETLRFLAEQPMKGFTYSFLFNGELYPNLNCSNWETSVPVLELEMNIIGPGTDTVAVYGLYGYEKREEIPVGPPWWEELLQPWIDILKGGNATRSDEDSFVETVIYVYNRTAVEVNCSENESIDTVMEDVTEITDYLSQDLGNYTLVTYFFSEEEQSEEPIICEIEACPIALDMYFITEEREVRETHCLPYEAAKFKIAPAVKELLIKGPK